MSATDEPRVTRPSLSAVFWLTAGVWAGIVLWEPHAWSFTGQGDILDGRALVMLLLSLGVGLAGICLRRRWTVTLIVLGALAGGIAVHGAVTGWRSTVELVETLQSTTVRAMVSDDPIASRFGTVVPVRFHDPEIAGEIRVSWPRDEEVPLAGQVVVVRGRVEPVDPAGDRALGYWRRGITGWMRPWSAEIAGWDVGPMGSMLRHRAETADLLRDVTGPGGALLCGILLGDKRRIAGTPVETDFRVAGLSHILAVSGLHLGLVSLLAARGARAMGWPVAAQAAVCLGSAIAFAAFTGFQTSTSRALVMVCIAWMSVLLGRRGDALAALSLAALVVLAGRPAAAFDISLQLSVSAVGGLLLFNDLVRTWLAEMLPGFMRRVASGLAATSVAQAATYPVVAPVFHAFSLVAPIANVIVLPLVAPALAMGLAGMAVFPVSADLGRGVLTLAAGLLSLAAKVAERLAALPGAAVAVDGLDMATGGALLVFAVLIWVRWPLPGSKSTARRVGLVAFALVVAVALGPPMRAGVVVMDVGQGDAILVRDGGETMLVDCAANTSLLLAALGRQHVRELDALILTHAHDDHIGGISGLTGIVRVGWVGVPAVAEQDDFEGARDAVTRLTPRGRVPWRALVAGDRWTVGEIRVTVLWPRDTEKDLETNDTSVVLMLEKDGFEMVLTGDAEIRALDGIAASCGLIDVDVLKLSHHGSANGLTQETLRGWDPEVAIASVGEDNSFGHPSQELLETLRAYGVEVLRTDLHGDVSLSFSGDTYRVTASGPSQ